MDATETDNESLVGDIAHIVAERPEGPRGVSELTVVQRDKYDNLLLLCKIHHKMIDDQEKHYTVAKLHEIKRAHENSVRKSLNPEGEKLQKAKEQYADYVDEWAARSDINRWKAWTSRLLSADGPHMTVERNQGLDRLGEWLLSRVWPKQLIAVEAAFNNFRRVLNDLLGVFHKYSEQHGDSLWTRKFYKMPEWNPALYQELAKQYDYHCELVEDLTLELTRAGNLICDRVRTELDAGFRIREGILLVESGLHADFSFRTMRTEYQAGELREMPYSGLEAFDRDRVSRDFHFGRPNSV